MKAQCIILILYLSIFVLNQNSAVVGARCRCLGGDASCWPNASQWQAFNNSVNGNLLTPIPTAAVCNGKTFDLNACTLVASQWRNATWRTDQVGAMQNHNWENSSCSIYFNSTSCNQGSVPLFAVKATTPDHVQKTVLFASTNNLRLVIKSTGHDYLGRSTAPGSLLLWLHYMKDMTLIPQYSSCNLSNIVNAARISAGAQWGDVYRWLNTFNLTAIGAASGTVSAVGGYLQGGGHSPLSRWKGLAVDQVLEYDVVTADGVRRTVNSCQNPDLFWALSGGGGGTYGVVLSAVIRTFPSPSVAVAIYAINAPNEIRYGKLIEDMVRLLPQLADAGWSGYFTMADLRISGLFHVPNGDVNVMNNTLNQLYLNNTDLRFDQSLVFTVPLFYYYFMSILEPGNAVGLDWLLSSRLIPDSIIRNNPAKVAQTFVQARGQMSMGSFLLGRLVAGGAVSNNPAFNISVNPAWRTSLLHMVATQGWLDTTSDSDKNYVIQQLANRTQMMDQLSNGSQLGCYTNEADPNELNWQVKYYGSQSIYDRLKAVKQSVDPNGLFICKNCVGSDDWTANMNCLKTSDSAKIHSYLIVFLMELALLSM